MTVPNVVKTSDGYPIHTLVESDGGEGLQMALWGAGATDRGLTGGERVRPAAVAGRVGEGAPATDGPVPVGGVYRTSPSAVDDGDVVGLICDSQGRMRTMIEDGKCETLGAINDERVDTDAPGTISGKLRGIIKLLNALHYTLSVCLPWSRGQKTMADSFPVAIASDQALTVTATQEQGTTGYSGRVTVSTVDSIMVVGSQSNRLRIWLCNDGNYVAWISFHASYSAGYGIRLAPEERIEIGPDWRGSIYAIAEGGTTYVTYCYILA